MASVSRILMITGPPGIGKTTVIQRTISGLKTRGMIVGGIVSREIRERGQRTGFEIIDLGQDIRGKLASQTGVVGPRLGKYRVNLKALAEIGAKALDASLQNCDVTVCDEIGPMELMSPEFRRAVEGLLVSSKPILGVIHWMMKEPLADRVRDHEATKLIEVTLENRSSLHETLVDLICQAKESQ